MLRMLIVATLLLLVSATSVQAGSSVDQDEGATVQLQIGARAGALAFLQPALRGEIDAANLYVTRTELHELLAQAFQLGNQPDSAAAHYRAVLRAWEHADPEFAPRVAAARRHLRETILKS